MENRVNIREPKPGSTVATKPNQGNTDRNGVFFCRPLFLWFVSFGGAKEMNRMIDMKKPMSARDGFILRYDGMWEYTLGELACSPH